MELELCKLLKRFADEDKGLDQYAIRKFAEAFEVVPRTLAENSGGDATAMMSLLHSEHAKENGANIGFEVEESKPMDAADRGVYDLYATKLNALRLAVDAAITVLKVDQIVMAKPAGGPKPKQGQNDPDN